MKISLFLSSALLATVASAQCETTVKTSVKRSTADIVDTATRAGSFKTLVAAVKAAGLEDVLRGKGPFTVFAPSDEAFAKLPKGTVASLLKSENKGKLQAILKFHVVAGEFDAKHVVGSEDLSSVLGQRLVITADYDGVRIGSAKIVKTDIAASNGIIHVIDSVLIPSDKPDIAELAAGAGTFETLLKAAAAAGLVDALRGEGPLTVLAPTDAAFAKIDAKVLASLLEPHNKAKLAAILEAHVVSGKVTAKAALAAETASTIGGNTLRFAIRDGRLKVNGVNIVKTDLEARNGIVHVIDTVILPE